MEFVLLNIASVGQPRRVEDAKLGRGYPYSRNNIDAYHYAVCAPKLVNTGGVGVTLVIRTTLFVGVVEDLEIVVINVLAGKGIGDKLQDCGLSDTSLPDKKDGEWRICFVL